MTSTVDSFYQQTPAAQNEAELKAVGASIASSVLSEEAKAPLRAAHSAQASSLQPHSRQAPVYESSETAVPHDDSAPLVVAQPGAMNVVAQPGAMNVVAQPGAMNTATGTSRPSSGGHEAEHGRSGGLLKSRADVAEAKFMFGKGALGGKRPGGQPPPGGRSTLSNPFQIGQPTSRDDFVPFTDPIVGTEPGKALFVVDIPPQRESEVGAPPRWNAPAQVALMTCGLAPCCYNVCFRGCISVVQKLQNLHNNLCLAAAEIELLNEMIACAYFVHLYLGDLSSKLTPAQRIVVTGTGPDSSQGLPQVTVEKYEPGAVNKIIDGNCCYIKCCRTSTGPTEERLKTTAFSLGDLHLSSTTTDVESQHGRSDCCCCQFCATCVPYHCCGFCYLEEPAKYKKTTSVSMKLSGGRSEEVKWATKAPPASNQMNADIKYSMVDHLKPLCQDVSSVGRTIVNVLQMLKSSGTSSDCGM